MGSFFENLLSGLQALPPARRAMLAVAAGGSLAFFAWLTLSAATPEYRALYRGLDEGDAARLYVCGPTPMMRRCAEIAAERGAPCVVSLENNMACGFGVCLGCAAPLAGGGFALVCRDGPMFDAGAIAWEGLP